MQADALVFSRNVLLSKKSQTSVGTRYVPGIHVCLLGAFRQADDSDTSHVVSFFSRCCQNEQLAVAHNKNENIKPYLEVLHYT